MLKLLGLFEDQIELVSLEARYHKSGLLKMAAWGAVLFCGFFCSVVLLHVALLSGLWALHMALWKSALLIALFEGLAALLGWLWLRSWSGRQKIFKSSREELKKTLLWMKERFS